MSALSDAQKRLWFLSQLENTTAYNVPVALRMRGPLDTAAIIAAVGDVVDRHEVLRTAYPSVDDEPHQRILAPGQVPSVVTTCSAAPDDVEEMVAALSGHAFDLADAPPVRAWLVTLGPQDHLLLVVIHHIAVDGWSISPLLRDLSAAYRARVDGGEPAWPELPIEYADYVAWHRMLLGDPADAESAITRQTAYWREVLDGLPEELTLPYDRNRPTVPTRDGDTVSTVIDAALHTELLALARHHDVTLFMVLQAAFAVLLSRLGAGDDIPLGSPVAGRTDSALDDLVGFFVNTLVLRTDLGGDPSFADLLRRVREVDLAAYAHQDVPFEQLVRELNPARSSSTHPLFQVMVVLQNNDNAAVDLPGVEVELQLVPNGGAKFDLTVGFSEESGPEGEPAGINNTVEFATDLFDRATIEPIARLLVHVLRSVVEQPDQPVHRIPLLSDEQRRVVLEDWSSRHRDLSTWHAVEAFEEQVHRAPDHVAVVCGQKETTYADLAERSDHVAAALVERGIGRGDLVSVCLPRGTDLVVTLLAILKAGGGYSVLDPTFPPDRLAAVVQAANSPLVVTDGERRERIAQGSASSVTLDELAATPAAPLASSQTRSTPDDPFCVMFTSGSTGQPKGVVATHRALVGTVVDQTYATFADETVLQCSPVSWDAFALELFGPLLAGGTVVLQPGERPEPAVIADLVRKHRVTTAHLSASLMNFMLDEYPGVFTGVRQLMTGGEPASVPHVTRALRDYPGLRLVNGYSPVENMIFTLCHVITPDDLSRPTIPVGRPVADKQVYVLDEHLQLVPPGVTGELYMAGSGLALGYAGQTALTAERFVANPFGPPGTRMYRTGDLVRWRRDGVMDFLGRADDQIKIRGFRVEPREIELVLSRHPDLTKSAVVVRQDVPGDKRLVAYVVPRQGRQPDQEALRSLAATHLPSHLVPSAFVRIDHLPLTPNGKLDKRALPEPQQVAPRQGRAPRTDTERALIELFEEVLGVTGITIDDDFFALGGHSLLATKLVSRARTRLGRELTITAIFDQRTVAGLSAFAETASSARPSLMAARANRLSESS